MRFWRGVRQQLAVDQKAAFRKRDRMRERGPENGFQKGRDLAGTVAYRQDQSCSLGAPQWRERKTEPDIPRGSVRCFSVKSNRYGIRQIQPEARDPEQQYGSDIGNDDHDAHKQRRRTRLRGRTDNPAPRVSQQNSRNKEGEAFRQSQSRMNAHGHESHQAARENEEGLRNADA